MLPQKTWIHYIGENACKIQKSWNRERNPYGLLATARSTASPRESPAPTALRLAEPPVISADLRREAIFSLAVAESASRLPRAGGSTLRQKYSLFSIVLEYLS
jgi:hypothetical protein